MPFSFLSRRTMKSEKSGGSGGPGLRYYGYLFVRLTQFAMALAVAGLYGQDLHNAAKANKYADPKWCYVVVVAGLSAVAAAVLVWPKTRTKFTFVVDFLFFFLWLVAFGIFGNMYIGEDPEGNAGVRRMTHAVWVLLANMLLWILTCINAVIVDFGWRRIKARGAHTSNV